MSVLTKMLSLFRAFHAGTNDALFLFHSCQPVIVYLVHLMLTIELLLVLCVPSNNEQFA